MHTIKLQLDDNLYEDITQSGIDIKEKFKEFLTDFIDDGYPAISTQEATKRVSKAINNYENNKGEYLTNEEYKSHMNKHIEKLKVKYADN